MLVPTQLDVAIAKQSCNSDIEKDYQQVQQQYVEVLAAMLRAGLAEDDGNKYKRRLAAMIPLFEQARDAICMIPLTVAKLRGLDLKLGDKMDVVGVAEDWEKVDIKNT